jgi:hypothetical protein
MLTIPILQSDNTGDFYPRNVQDRRWWRGPLSLLSDLFIAAVVPLRMCSFQKS